MAHTKLITCSFLALFIIAVCCFGISNGQLQVDFYSQACPSAESIVQNTVQSAVSNDGAIAARLLRLFFHDCFINGCDGSILLGDSSTGERRATGNLGLAGFEVIQNAKTELESVCPGVVSCADIVALAARDSVALSDGPFFSVPTGRRDGRVSNFSLAENLPEVDEPIDLLRSKFREKGLSDTDLVLLSGGAHTIGSTACFFMARRLYNFTGNNDSDPAINPQLLPQLKARCPLNGDQNVRIPLDLTTEFKFDDQIYRNIRAGFAVISSDARLYNDKTTKRIVDSYIGAVDDPRRPSFKADFAKAMIKLGNIGVKTGSQGEIRLVCNAFN